MAYIDVQTTGDDSSPAPTGDTAASDEKAQTLEKAHTVEGDLDSDLASMILNERNRSRRRGDRSITESYHQVPSFSSVVRLIARSVAEVSWGVEDDGEPVDDHPLLDVMQRPSGLHIGHEFRFTWQVHLDLHGEAFALIEEGDGRPVLTLIPPTDIRRGRDGGWDVNHGGLNEEVPETDVIHLRHANPAEPYGRGVGLGRVLADELEIDEAAAETEKLEFRNNGIPAFILHLPGANKDQLKRFQQNWRNKHRGTQNTGKGAFLGEAASDSPVYQEISRELADMEIAELRDFSRQVIRKTFGVPPELLGEVRDSNRATISEAQSIFAEQVLMPRLKFMRRHLQHKLVPRLEDSDGIKLTFDDPRPEDHQRKLDVLSETPWALTRNEIRDVAGLPPREDGDEYVQPPKLEGQTAGEIEGESTGGDTGTRAKSPNDSGDATDGEADTESASESGDTIIKVKRFWSGKQEPNPDLTPEEIAQKLKPEFLAESWEDEYEDEVRDWIERTSEGLGVRPSFEVINPMIRDHLQEWTGEKIKNINATTQQQVQDTLEEGLDQGLGSQELAGKLDDFYQGTVLGSRAEVIARTEMLRASNWATDQAHKASGVVDEQEWIATMDSRVRAEHAAMDGQITDIDKPFTAPGGATAKMVGRCPVHEQKHPGGFGVARLDIQCRCTLGAVINERAFQRLAKKGVAPGYANDNAPARVAVKDSDGNLSRAATREETWKAFDDALEQSEKRFLAVVRDGLRRQKAEQLDPALDDALDLQDAA